MIDDGKRAKNAMLEEGLKFETKTKKNNDELELALFS